LRPSVADCYATVRSHYTESIIGHRRQRVKVGPQLLKTKRHLHDWVTTSAKPVIFSCLFVYWSAELLKKFHMNFGEFLWRTALRTIRPNNWLVLGEMKLGADRRKHQHYPCFNKTWEFSNCEDSWPWLKADMNLKL